jgi:hypothetical protein
MTDAIAALPGTSTPSCATTGSATVTAPSSRRERSSVVLSSE